VLGKLILQDIPKSA